jgi:hypothetical protein
MRKERTMGRIISEGMATQEKITRMVNFFFINPRQLKKADKDEKKEEEHPTANGEQQNREQSS